MRKPSREQLESQLRQADSERTVLAQGLNDVMNGNVIWGKWVTDKGFLVGNIGTGGKYRIGVSRLDSASGGLVFQTYRTSGQNDHTAVYYLESWYSETYRAAVYGSETARVCLESYQDARENERDEMLLPNDYLDTLKSEIATVSA